MDLQAGVRFSGFAVNLRRLAPWLVLIACLSAAGTPALAREGADPGAPGRAELQRDVKESTARYRQAKAEVDRLAAKISRLEKRLVGVDEQQAGLRSMATKGAVALYMHDSTSDWAGGFGDGGEQVLEAARRARLIGDVNQLAAAAVRNLGDSVWLDIKHFDLPASTGSGSGKVVWGSGLPVRYDIRVKGDSVALNDVAWVYPTLPRTGGGSMELRIRNQRDNLRIIDYALSKLDVNSMGSHLTGAMTFGVGGPVLIVKDVALEGSPIDFRLLHQLNGKPLPVDWQGQIYGVVRGPGGPVNRFRVADARGVFQDAHVRGATSRFAARGELDILLPAFTVFHGFEVESPRIDLRTIEFLYPNFPRLGGYVVGRAVLDSSWLDVRFRDGEVTHYDGPATPSHATGSGRVTYGEQFMTYDVSVNAQPVSLTMLSRAYPLGLHGVLTGPIQAKGTTDTMQLSLDLTGPAGRITYNGTVDAYPLSVAAHGGGRVERLDLSQLVGKFAAPPASLTGNYQLDVRGDTNDLRTLAGHATVLLERSDFDGIRLSPSRLRARFGNGRMYVDTLRIESFAGSIGASGAIGLGPGVSDSLRYQITVDYLEGLRRYISPFLSSSAQPGVAVSTDSIAGSGAVSGMVRGSLDRLDVSGRMNAAKVYLGREAGRTLTGTFALSDVARGPRGTASLRVDTLSIGGIAMDTLGLSVRFDAPERGVFTLGGVGVNGVTLSMRGDMALGDSTRSVVMRDLALDTDSSRWRLAGPAVILARGKGVSIDSLVLVNGRAGRIALEGSVPDSGKAKFLFSADSVPLRDVGRIAQLTTPLSGWAHVTAQGAGSITAPVVNVQTTLTAVRYGGAHVERVNGVVEYLGKRADVSMDLASGGRTALVARASLPIELKYFGARLLDDSLRGTIRTDSASFDIIEALIPGLRDATGKLAANLAIAGTWKHPDLAGQLKVDNGEVTVDALGIRMKGVNVDVALFGHNDSLAVRRFVGWSGATAADSISLRGYVAYSDLDDPYLSLTLNARTFHALDRRSLARLDVSTERDGVRLRGRLHGATLTGGLIVDRGTIFLPDPELARKQVVDLTSQFVDTSTAARQLLPAPPSKLLESLIIDGVRVTLGDEVWLRSREANVKLAGSLNVQRSSRTRRGTILGVGTATGSDTLGLAFEGVLRAERGTYTLSLGLVQREFQVEGGTITFYPNPEIAPELNISAVHTVHTVRSENKADLRIRVRLTGPLFPNPIVSLESAESFALSQSDLVSYLIFGQPNFELGNESQGYVQLAAQTLFPSLQTVATSQLRGVLGSWADIVQLRPGSSDPTAWTNADTRSEAFGEIFWTSRLGAEKQLSDNVFVSLSTGICQFSPKIEQTSSASQWEDFYNGLSGKIEWRLSGTASVKAGKEPSAQVCGRQSIGRLVPTPSQWGLSLFKSWRF